MVRISDRSDNIVSGVGDGEGRRDSAGQSANALPARVAGIVFCRGTPAVQSAGEAVYRTSAETLLDFSNRHSRHCTVRCGTEIAPWEYHRAVAYRAPGSAAVAVLLHTSRVVSEGVLCSGKTVRS